MKDLTSVPLQDLIYKATIESLSIDVYESMARSQALSGFLAWDLRKPWSELTPLERSQWRITATDLLQEHFA